MRHNKPFTVISYQKEDEIQHFRCKIHGCRLLEIPGKGYWCAQGCGPTYGKTRIVETHEQILQTIGKKKPKKKLHYVNGLH